MHRLRYLVITFFVITTCPAIFAQDDLQQFMLPANTAQHTQIVGNKAVQFYFSQSQYPTLAIFSTNADSNSFTVYRYKLSQRTGIPVEVTQATGTIGSDIETINRQWLFNQIDSQTESSKSRLTEAKVKIIEYDTHDPFVFPSPVVKIELSGITFEFDYGNYSFSSHYHREPDSFDFPTIECIQSPEADYVLEFNESGSRTLATYTGVYVLNVTH